MTVPKDMLEQKIFSLLKTWCDRLIGLQLDLPGESDLDGAILCPACKVVHGRCTDAIYPFMYLADKTGDEKYLAAAKKLFTWGGNMLCDDGGLYNDAQSVWKGTTVFGAVSLCDALRRHGRILDDATRAQWEDRLRKNGEWLFRNMRIGMRTNINYFATNCCAMAILGKYFGRQDYLSLAKELADYCLEHMSVNGLLYGESQPNDRTSEKGCPSIDVGGYNVEESLPSLYRYAVEAGDAQALGKVTDSYRAHLEFMLPDGAWDNSLGSRTFKWTWWGSRTSDGCQEALFSLGKKDPVFAEAALRNLELYIACTHNGLLCGGRDYHAHGERPCVHHAFCHAKVLAGVLDEGLCDIERTSLPSDDFSGVRYYRELDTFRLGIGDWRANVTAYDYNYMKGGHASGGTLNMLWNKKTGPVIAVGAVDYSMEEPHNQQLSLKSTQHRSVCPRFEMLRDGVRYGSQYDFGATAELACDGEKRIITSSAVLCGSDNKRLPAAYACALRYTFDNDEVTIAGKIDAALSGEVSYILPVVKNSASVGITGGTLLSSDEIFDLNPGFICTEYVIRPDDNGEVVIRIRA